MKRTVIGTVVGGMETTGEVYTVSLWFARLEGAFQIGQARTDDTGRFRTQVDLPSDATWPPTVLAQVADQEGILPTRPCLVRFDRDETTQTPGEIELHIQRQSPPVQDDDLTLGEVGAALVTAHSVAEAEFGRYPESRGDFRFEVFDVNLPVTCRVDEFGRFRMQLNHSSAEATQLRLAISPRGESTIPPRPMPLVDLGELPFLNEIQLAALRQKRIHDLQDLAHLLAQPRVRNRLTYLDLPTTEIAGVYTLLFEGGLPPAAGRALLKIGFLTVESFESAPADEIASALRSSGVSEVQVNDIKRWQDLVHENIWGTRKSAME